ncbi:DUF1573 domain-containing protein [Sulfuriroseicoccus oceanibius]|uniref:DUF1573 domain-containing protein n=1 Tax=Sulfuriroseicoccus oceanibius TaxID=2707525 RepID=A0A6B3L414_9BACT|nr:DUF1573 domain-containing protein [Sulfuriroseicoccus oceanibius]QQL46223.1 DUF1573 domain-containing protein [Sulfuriroseicoccus oceanibius]
MSGLFNRLLSRAAWLFGYALVTGALGGPLKFDVTLREADATPEQDRVPVSFPYHNPHDIAVEIVEFRSTCGACLTAGPKQKVDPGGKSAVDALFLVGAVGGKLEKKLTVVMRDANGAFHEQDLTVRVTVPEVVQVRPKKLEWALGGEGGEQVFDVKIPGDDPIHVTAARCTRPAFAVIVDEVEKGRHYRVRVTPSKLDVPQLGLLKIETDCPIEKYKNHIVFVAVRE